MGSLVVGRLEVLEIGELELLDQMSQLDGGPELQLHVRLNGRQREHHE